MKVGTTNLEVGTRIRITDSTEKDLIGITGTLTHAFDGLKVPNTNYIGGLYVDTDVKNPSPYGKICNLIKGDKFEVIE